MQRKRMTLRLSTLIAALLAMPAVIAQSPSRELVEEHSRIYVPTGVGPFPTLIAVPGCSGVAFQSAEAERTHPALTEDDRIFRAHYPRMAERLRSEGFTVVLVDILSAEGRVTACGDVIPAQRIAAYIDAAISWAVTEPYVDAEKLGILAWSMGGWGTLAWLAQQDQEPALVRSAAVVYPACFEIEPLRTAMPVLMLLGDADDIADPSICQHLVDSSPVTRSITVHRFPGARHGFDAEGAPTVLATGNGMSIGYQEAAAAESWAHLIDFFTQNNPPIARTSRL